MSHLPPGEGGSCDAVVNTHCDNRSEAEDFRKRLGPGYAGKPLFWASYVADDPGRLKGKAVAALSGLARPAKFESTLAGLGTKIVSFHRFRDHHAYTVHDLQSAESIASARGAALVVTTEKDAVRIPKGFKPTL